MEEFFMIIVILLGAALVMLILSVLYATIRALIDRLTHGNWNKGVFKQHFTDCFLILGRIVFFILDCFLSSSDRSGSSSSRSGGSSSRSGGGSSRGGGGGRSF